MHTICPSIIYIYLINNLAIRHRIRKTVAILHHLTIQKFENECYSLFYGTSELQTGM